jgi:hypothetical protein
MKIILENSQIMMVAQAGVMRHIQFIARNAKCQHGQSEPTTWEMQIEGCLSEYALSLYLGVEWKGTGKIGGVDVGKDNDVRCTPRADGSLIIHKNDDDNRKYWLMVGKNGTYEVKGWLLGKDGKNERYWSDPSGKNRPAYFVPQSALKDIF